MVLESRRTPGSGADGQHWPGPSQSKPLAVVYGLANDRACRSRVVVTWPEQRVPVKVYAAGWYSLITPPSTFRRCPGASVSTTTGWCATRFCRTERGKTTVAGAKGVSRSPADVLEDGGGRWRIPATDYVLFCRNAGCWRSRASCTVGLARRLLAVPATGTALHPSPSARERFLSPTKASSQPLNTSAPLGPRPGAAPAGLEVVQAWLRSSGGMTIRSYASLWNMTNQ